MAVVSRTDTEMIVHSQSIQAMQVVGIEATYSDGEEAGEGETVLIMSGGVAKPAGTCPDR